MVGIPMGTNSGTNIVGFYLVSYELKFMTQLVKKAKWDLLRLFVNSIRYLDDLLNINNAHFSQLIYTDHTCEGVQGKAVTLQIEAKGYSVNYMDSTISRFPFVRNHCLSHKLYTKTYDKRTGIKWKHLKIIKYPSA